MLGIELGPELGDVSGRVPDVQVPHASELAHGLPVAGHRGHDDIAALLGGEAVLPAGDFQAGGQYGSDWVSMYAVHAIAAHRPS